MRTHTQDRDIELFERMPVFRSILTLALPSVIGQIILVIYNIADTFFVGLTGSDSMITAVTVCMPAFMFLSAISNLFGVGGSSVISRLLGSGDRATARQASAFALWGCLAATILYAAGVWLFLDGFVDLLGGSNPTVHSHACQYMKAAVISGGIVTTLNTLFSHLIRAEGRSLEASLGIMIGGVLNILLDPLFMFVLLPAGNEVLGAALATMLANCGALLYFFLVLSRNRSRRILSFYPSKAMLGGRLPQDILAVGIPACLMTLCENISYAVLDKQMAAAGIAQQAGIGVAKKVNMLAHCTVRGMAQGVLPLIGYTYAAGNRKRMRHTVYLSAAMSILLSTLCMLVCLTCAGTLIGVFLQEGSASQPYGEAFLRILCLGAPFSAWAYTVISFFQATGHMQKSLVLALMRKGILDIPLMFLLSRWVPVYGLVAATPAADLLCCAAAAVLFVQFLKAHKAQDIPMEREPLSLEKPMPMVHPH